MQRYLMKLFVTGQTPRSYNAIANLRSLCESEFPGQYEITVIDVLESPELAEKEHILATPTLIKELPPPIRRVIGDLSERDKVFAGLGLLVLPRGGDAQGGAG